MLQKWVEGNYQVEILEVSFQRAEILVIKLALSRHAVVDFIDVLLWIYSNLYNDTRLSVKSSRLPSTRKQNRRQDLFYLMFCEETCPN